MRPQKAVLPTTALAFLMLLPSLPAQQNTLKISSQPPNAQVYLDDEPKGTTSPDEGRMVLKDLPADSYKLRIALSGYKDWIQAVILTEGSTVYVDARLVVAGPAPLTSQDVVDLLKGGVSTKRAEQLVKEHGVDFALTEPIEKEIRAAGGDDAMLLVITKAKAAPAPSPPPAVPPTLTLLEPKGAEAGKPIEASGPTLRVRGTAFHASGIASVFVNGQAALLKVSASGEVEFEAANLALASGTSALVLIATAADRSQAQLQLALKVGPNPGDTPLNSKPSERERSAAAENGGEVKFAVRHFHGGLFDNNYYAGVLTISSNTVRFEETGKGGKPSHDFQVSCTEVAGVERTADYPYFGIKIKLNSGKEFELMTMDAKPSGRAGRAAREGVDDAVHSQLQAISSACKLP